MGGVRERVELLCPLDKVKRERGVFAYEGGRRREGRGERG